MWNAGELMKIGCSKMKHVAISTGGPNIYQNFIHILVITSKLIIMHVQVCLKYDKFSGYVTLAII